MSQRKPYNHQARLANYYRSMLRSNHVAVLDIEHLELQVLVDWKHARAIGNGREAVATAVTDMPHAGASTWPRCAATNSAPPT